MKNQLDGKTGAAVLDELIRQLKNRGSISQMLGDLGADDPNALVTQLVDELERIVKWQHLQHELTARTTAPPAPSRVADAKPEPAPAPKAETTLKPESKPEPKPERKAEPRPAPKLPPKPVAPAEVPIVPPATPVGRPPEQVVMPEPTPPAPEQEDDDVEDAGETTQKQLPRVPSELEADAFLYLHGVSRIDPGDTPSAVPFLLEEKGIDNRSFAFALDHQGLRFYGSVLSREATNLTKNGVLLLSKQEKIRMRGAHESILNDLRLHGILLPFEFGTVFSGPAEMKDKIGERFSEIQDALAELLRTRWWNLTVYALDSRTAELVGASTPGARREIDRGRVPYSSPAQVKRIDVKTLERILNKQKRAAEAVHEALQPYAERSDIDMMVSLQSGSSDDWKIILKVSYELSSSILTQFVRTVTDLQYQHFLMELMLSLAGNVESFSFVKARTTDEH